MASDMARAIVELAVGRSPTLRIYRIPSNPAIYYDEIVVHGKVVKHRSVNEHMYGRGYAHDRLRFTNDLSHCVELTCNDPIPAMRIAFGSGGTWAVDVNNTRIYEFDLDRNSNKSLDEQEEFARVCSIVLGYR